jgi:hypothetical protein
LYKFLISLMRTTFSTYLFVLVEVYASRSSLLIFSIPPSQPLSWVMFPLALYLQTPTSHCQHKSESFAMELSLPLWVCSLLFGNHECKRPFGSPRRRWEDNIKIDLREI